MNTSLGLMGDSDEVALIVDIEKAFGCRLADKDLSQCQTVGQLFELIKIGLPNTRQAGNCGTAMCFYRLRRSLQPLVKIELKPKTPITALNTLSVRKLHQIIKEECGLRPPLEIVSMWGCATLTFTLVLPIALIVLDFPLWSALASVVVTFGLYKLMPVQLPDEIVTFGDLVRIVASRSIGHLANQGARLGPTEAWVAFRDVIGDHLGISKEMITSETLLLEPK